MDKRTMLTALVDYYDNGNKSQFAKRLGISPQGVSTWLSRGTLDSELIFAKCEHISPSWLLTGKGEMLLDDLRDRLSYILLLTNSDYVSSLLGVDRFELTNYCNGGKKPSVEMDLGNLLAYIPVNSEWLLNGVGDKYRIGTIEENEARIREMLAKQHIEENNEVIRKELEPTINQEYSGSPYFNVDFIGGFELLMNDQTSMPDFYINYPPYNKEGVLWVNLTGKSMEPELSNGDIIAIKEMNTPIQYLPTKEIYAIVTEDYRTVKRIELSIRDGYVRLIPSNKDYQVQEIPTSMITKVFAVLGSIRKFF